MVSQTSSTYLTDLVGSVMAQSKADQTIQSRYGYSPYGEVATQGGDNGNATQYTARENDNTGLYYYRARYYDPVLKRFISSDPIGLAGGINTYAYVEGNPLSYTDPMGLMAMGLGGLYPDSSGHGSSPICAANEPPKQKCSWVRRFGTKLYFVCQVIRGLSGDADDDSMRRPQRPRQERNQQGYEPDKKGTPPPAGGNTPPSGGGNTPPGGSGSTPPPHGPDLIPR